METTAEKVTTPSFLSAKIVKVEVVKRDSEYFPKGHDAEGQFSGARFGVDLPLDMKKGGQLFNPFSSEEERRFFEKELSMDEGTLSIHKPKGSSFWVGPNRFCVYVDKTGIILDLSNPMDMLKYKVLKANSNKVAPTWKDRLKPGMKYVLIEEGEQIEEQLNASTLRRKADKFLGSIASSRKKMRDLLRLYNSKFGIGRTVPEGRQVDFYEAEIDKLITEPKSLVNLISIIDDPYYEMKLFIEDALAVGAIVKPSKNTYSITGTDEEFTQVDLIEYLNPKGKNQNVYLKIKEQIKISE